MRYPTHSSWNGLSLVVARAGTRALHGSASTVHRNHRGTHNGEGADRVPNDLPRRRKGVLARTVYASLCARQGSMEGIW